MLASWFFINSGTLTFQAVGLLTKISKIFAVLLTKSASLLTGPFLDPKSLLTDKAVDNLVLPILLVSNW